MVWSMVVRSRIFWIWLMYNYHYVFNQICIRLLTQLLCRETFCLNLINDDMRVSRTKQMV